MADSFYHHAYGYMQASLETVRTNVAVMSRLLESGRTNDMKAEIASALSTLARTIEVAERGRKMPDADPFSSSEQSSKTETA